MAITSNRRDPAEYVPEADVTETLPDGRTIQIAVAGHPMPLSTAIKAGLVGPSETKEAPRRPAPAPEPAPEDGPGDAGMPVAAAPAKKGR